MSNTPSIIETHYAELDDIADAYASGELTLPDQGDKARPQPCEACGSAPRFLIGVHCMACGHDQGQPMHAGAFSLGAL